MQISNIQLRLIEKAKVFLEKKTHENINVYNSGVCYFCTSGLTPGYARLKFWSEGFISIFYSIKVLLKDIISISNLHSYQLINKPKKDNQYEKIIVSWARKEDFLSDGSYLDKYFKSNSRDQENTLWFLVYQDEILPEKIDRNILIFMKSKKIFKYNFFYLLKYIFKSIFYAKFSIKKFFHKISWYTGFSTIVCDNIKEFISIQTKVVIMPYEGQPFQNAIFKESKKINQDLKTIGYVHSFPVGLPTNFLFREGSPEKLIINGEDQYYCFSKYLNWKADQLSILPSSRFLKDSKDMSGYIFLPISLNSVNKTFYCLEKFLNSNRKNIFDNFIVKNHPFSKQSKKHLRMIGKINNLLSELKNSDLKKNNKKKISIFIGATSSIIEALERDIEVIHICENPIFESYSNELWPSIKVTKIDANIFKYQLLKKGNLIKLGNNNEIFKTHYLN